MSAHPALRVVHGSPTPEELAVLTAVVSAAGGDETPAPQVRRGGWSDRGARHRRMPAPGPNAWRSSLR